MERTKINRKIIPLAILFIIGIVILNINFVLAAVTLVRPAAATNHTTTMIVNCTNTADSVDFALNATIYYNVSGGAADTRLATILNDSADDVEFYNSAVSISSLAAGATYNFSCRVFNLTASVNSTGRAGITIDNTVPSCTSTRERNKIEIYKAQTLTCTCTDNLDSSPTITRTLTKPTTATVSPTATSYTASGTDVNEIGAYTWACSATDYTRNNGSATSLSFTVSSGVDAVAPEDKVITRIISEGAGGNTILIVGGVMLIILTIVVVILVNKR